MKIQGDDVILKSTLKLEYLATPVSCYILVHYYIEYINMFIKQTMSMCFPVGRSLQTGNLASLFFYLNLGGNEVQLLILLNFCCNFLLKFCIWSMQWHSCVSSAAMVKHRLFLKYCWQFDWNGYQVVSDLNRFTIENRAIWPFLLILILRDNKMMAITLIFNKRHKRLCCVGL